MPKINIIGAGISGLAAAVNLLDFHPKLEVEIFEATKQAGGRLKPLYIPKFKQEIENPHLIAACNCNALNLLKITGQEKLEKVKFKTTSFNPLLLYRLFVESALNTQYENADHKLALKVMARILSKGGRFFHADPHKFIDGAINFIQSKNGKINFNHNITSLNEFDKKERVIIASDPNNIKKISNLDFEVSERPIVNIHFKYDLNIDYTWLCPDVAFPCVIFYRNGIISITVSSAFKLITYKDKNIINIMWKLIQKLFNLTKGVPLAVVTKNRRATVRTNTAGIGIVSHHRPIICSDFSYHFLPSTIEAGIMSGFNQTNILLQELEK